MYWIEVRLLQRNACAARSSTCIAGEHGRIWMTVHRYVQLWRDLHLQEHDNLALKQDAVNVGIGNVQRHTTQDSDRSEEHTSELQSRLHLVCRLLLEKKKKKTHDCSDTCTPHTDQR